MASPAPAKSQPLHNFSLPHLKWRNHRTGRNRLAGDTSSSPPSTPWRESSSHQSAAYVSRRPSPLHTQSRSESESDQNGVVRIMKPKVFTKVIKPMDNSKGKRANKKICIRFRKNDVKHDVTEDNQQNGVVQSTEEEDTLPKIWNLRPRRPLISNKQSNIGSLALPENNRYYSHGCNNSNNNNNQTNKEECSIPMTSSRKHNKLSISLTRDEIEGDMFALTGAKPSRRPKKRPRTVQKQLDATIGISAIEKPKTKGVDTENMKTEFRHLSCSLSIIFGIGNELMIFGFTV
ncbi:uncharacterized protein LOC143598166 [Bidens hawaiensis]|uniref:uncharacterized protein LOC143598166 n=1 Tax=Bidens hawaiensis TaxID=980011 RepID=UPI004049E6AB